MNGFADLFFLHCDGYATHKQADCRTYDDSGTLTYANQDTLLEKIVIMLGIRIIFTMTQ